MHTLIDTAQFSPFFWLMFLSLPALMSPCKLADLQQGIVGWISSASFILKLSVPLSPTLQAALFITCNHNNWSFLFAKRNEILSLGVYVLQIKRMSECENAKTFINILKADVILTC